MATAEDLGEEDEWEIINDDGFVFKRKKRRLDSDPTVAASASASASDPAAEEKNRRERRKRALTKLRDKYQIEIDQWEHLSNTLKAMQQKAALINDQQQLTTVDLPFPPVQSSDSSCQRLVDDLLLKVEAEEAIIQDVSNLCDLAEAICKAQEDQMKWSLVDLPIWGSPGELMTSLCDS